MVVSEPTFEKEIKVEKAEEPTKLPNIELKQIVETTP